MFSTSTPTAAGRAGTFGLKLGALVAASSLMLAGGVAVATSAYAAPNDNANSQGKKPDKDGGNNSGANNNPDAPGQNDNNGGAVGGDNGGANGGGPGNNSSQNSNNGDLGTGTLTAYVCHATRSAQNPYVYLQVDASSVDELLKELTGRGGGGNGHGDHVGEVFDGSQRSGNNWGDIITPVSGKVVVDGETVIKTFYPGLNYSGLGKTIFDNGCQLPFYAASTEVCAIAPEASAYADQTVDVPRQYATQAEADAALATKLEGYTIDTTGAECGGGGGEFETASAPGVGVVWCPVVDGQYVGKQLAEVPAPASVTVAKGAAAQAQTALEAGVEAALLSAVGAAQNGQPDSIIPPVTYQGRTIYPGHNWKGDFINRYDAGCSPNQRVLAAISAPAAATTPGKKPAAGSPQPGTVPVPAAGAPLPGSVPAGDGSSIPGLPVWAMALLAVGAIGAAASGMSLATSRKR